MRELKRTGGQSVTATWHWTKLVDVNDEPIREITADGIRAGEREIPLDILIFATGFDAMTGSLLAVDIRGRGGKALNAVWALKVTCWPTIGRWPVSIARMNASRLRRCAVPLAPPWNTNVPLLMKVKIVDGRMVVVLATDGAPTACAPPDMAALAELAEEAFEGPGHVRAHLQGPGAHVHAHPPQHHRERDEEAGATELVVPPF